MTDLLSLGAAGVHGYSRALQAVGDNIANAQTPGYARRSVVLAEQLPGGQSVLYRNQVAPGGVLATGVSRAVDPWLIEDSRAAGADVGRSGARLTGLEAVETALADGGGGVGRAMTSFFNRADELAADPSNATRRLDFLQSADDIAASLHRTADGLSRAATGISSAATGAVDQINGDLQALASVNAGLRRARDGSSNQATLLDERDRLIDSISATLPVDLSFDARGAATLKVAGNALIDGADRETIAATAGSDGRLALSATGPTGSFALGPQTGTFSGLIDAADHIATQRTALDALATDFAASVNAQHVAGRDANGNPGLPLFTVGIGATDIAAVGLAVADVAAADTANSNGNALAFGALRGNNGGEARWATLAAQQSQTVASARAQDSVATTRRDGAASARSDLSGVDLDKEAADLVRFQQAYQASARVIQTARETMQTILNAL